MFTPLIQLKSHFAITLLASFLRKKYLRATRKTFRLHNELETNENIFSNLRACSEIAYKYKPKLSRWSLWAKSADSTILKQFILSKQKLTITSLILSRDQLNWTYSLKICIKILLIKKSLLLFESWSINTFWCCSKIPLFNPEKEIQSELKNFRLNASAQCAKSKE